MRIAYILSNSSISPTNGVVSQALTWKSGLELLGHEVILIDMWKKNDWAKFDIIHFFGFSIYMRDFIIGMYNINSNIIVSPILDPNYSIFKLKLYSLWGSSKLNLTNPYYGLASIKNKVKGFLVRSDFEKKYMVSGFGIEPSYCQIVPLSFGRSLDTRYVKKENFCLHISLLADDRKNVQRLIQAAKKFNFKLILGGLTRNKEELNKVLGWISGHTNIDYIGFVTNDELADLYSRAKVFALPSICEGVGIVALEAASMGCDIVMTNVGGPKEYYNNLAKFVNPYNVDDIGNAVVEFLNGDTFQPNLKTHIDDKFSLLSVSKKLSSIYSNI